MEADTFLSEMHEKSNEVTPIPNESVQKPLNGVISFKIPQVVKGPKNTRFKNAVEKKTGKKKKGAQKKGSEPAHYVMLMSTNFFFSNTQEHCVSFVLRRKRV